MKNVAMNHTTVDFLDKFGTRGHSPLHLLVWVAFSRKTELRMGMKTSSTTSEVNNVTIRPSRSGRQLTMSDSTADCAEGEVNHWPIYEYTLHLLLFIAPQIPLQR